MKQPLVSVIVPTRNSADVLEACLQSIQAQTYKTIELIVVDRNSTDNTKQIAKKYTDRIFNKEPERSTQRNYGVDQARGEYVCIIDSDMQLTPQVVEACVAKATTDKSVQGVIVPEESFGKGFWAQCKRLERSFYIGIRWMEAARFFNRDTYQKLGGYDTTLVSGEDWDLSKRVEKTGKVVSINELIMHNEGRLSLLKTLKKKYYYAAKAKAYLARNPVSSKLAAEVGPLRRYQLFFSRPGKLFKNPLLGIGMLFMKTAEFAAGGLGYISAGKDGNGR